jgi:predicted solute-binding protein
MSEETSELAERGNEIFERVVRPQVDVDEEAQKFVAIDVESEDFEVDSNQRAALDHLLERRPDARGRIFFRRVGSRFAHRIGGRLREGDTE